MSVVIEKTKITLENTRDFRNFLLEQMVAVATGELDPVKAGHIVNFAQQIYNTLNIELKAALLLSKTQHSIGPVEFMDHEP